LIPVGITIAAPPTLALVAAACALVVVAEAIRVRTGSEIGAPG
jgi:hypothetical protein